MKAKKIVNCGNLILSNDSIVLCRFRLNSIGLILGNKYTKRNYILNIIPIN